MPHENPVIVSGAAEGDIDEAVLRRLISEAGGSLERVYGRSGKNQLHHALPGYNNAARYAPWVVLIDLDHDADCPPPFCATWLPNPSVHMCFRVAVREVESWLIADSKALARFLGVRVNRITTQPEALENPKQEMVNLARQSSRSAIRQGMVPRRGSGREVGAEYTSRVIEFVNHGWNPEIAAARADSLRRCRERVRELVNAALRVPLEPG